MDKEYVCCLVKPRKYHELLSEKYNMFYVKPPKQENGISYGKIETQTIYSLPFELSNDIDEDIKMLTKEEYEEYRMKSIKEYEDFILNDYMSDDEFRR